VAGHLKLLPALARLAAVQALVRTTVRRTVEELRGSFQTTSFLLEHRPFDVEQPALGFQPLETDFEALL
jgi:hypothetical protein